jgi:hypothetical protein
MMSAPKGRSPSGTKHRPTLGLGRTHAAPAGSGRPGHPTRVRLPIVIRDVGGEGGVAESLRLSTPAVSFSPRVPLPYRTTPLADRTDGLGERQSSRYC